MSESDFFESRPQRLCKMCGGCCRVVTTATPYEDLKKLAEEGEAYAIDFLELFEPFESIEAAKAVNKGIVDNILNEFKNNEELKDKNITFYTCRYLLENNLCRIYENRKELCKRCPSSPWVVTPPGCGYEGWLFQQREEIKQKVRKQKENLLYAQTLFKEAQTPEEEAKINQVIENIKNAIKQFEKYGSADW